MSEVAKREWKPGAPRLKVVTETNRKLIVSSEDFVSGFKPPEYLVDGLLQRRFFYSMTAPTGGGKTAIALLLSALVATGEAVAGHRVEQGRVLYLAGENPDDIRMRWMAMAEKMSFETGAVPVHFIEGLFSIPELFDRMAGEIAQIGDMSLIVVDTSAAYFGGDDENNNVQMGEHARMLRRLTTLPGHPCVIVACHPTKNAGNDNLLPRGGGAFTAEVDGNFVCVKKDGIVDLHWQGKLRGPDFAPIAFELTTVTSEALKDLRGEFIPTVLAKPLTEALRSDIESKTRRDEDELLVLMNTAPGGSIASMATALGWLNAKGEPRKDRVHRTLKRLEKFKFVTIERDQYVLTEKGKTAAKKAG